jgi:hypothetical protein
MVYHLSAKTSPRIAIAGLSIESSTFSPALTNEEAFHTKYGTDIFSLYPFLSPDSRCAEGQHGFRSWSETPCREVLLPVRLMNRWYKKHWIRFVNTDLMMVFFLTSMGL